MNKGWLQPGNTNRMTHGMSGTPTYSSWLRMKARCNDTNNNRYDNYGGRGISYDPRWEEFENFYADMGERLEGTTLDRIDSNQDYSKGNCRWATDIEQGNNKRNTLRYNDETVRDMLPYAVEGISFGTLATRLRRGWSAESALSTPVMCRNEMNAKVDDDTYLIVLTATHPDATDAQRADMLGLSSRSSLWHARQRLRKRWRTLTPEQYSHL